ncbi:hypothetical protein L3Q82_015498, partial [Scortum barcoo]
SSRARCFRFELDGTQVGWVPPHVASQLVRYPEVFSPPQGGALTLSPGLDSYRSRSEAVDQVLKSLRQEDCFSCLRGWRDERYSVMADFSEPPVMWMERAATGLFGVKRYGVHINGYTVGGGGRLRSACGWPGAPPPSRRTPDCWTTCRRPGCRRRHQTHGGQRVSGGGVYPCCHRGEGSACEHAQVRRRGARKGRVKEKDLNLTGPYTYEDEEGVFAESQFVFDLELPLDFRPTVGDGEVQEFYLLPIDRVKELLPTDDFKPNCAMVVLDFLIRHSFIDPDSEPCYQQFVSGLHQTL